MRAALCEVWAKAISPHVLHLVLVWKRRDSALWVFFGKLFVKEDEVGEAATDGEFRLLEGLEVGLDGVSSWRDHRCVIFATYSYLCSDLIRHVWVWRTCQLFQRAADIGFQAPFAEVGGHCAFVPTGRIAVKMSTVVFFACQELLRLDRDFQWRGGAYALLRIS